MASKALKLYLDSSLWTQELADELTNKGHEVFRTVVPDEVDAIVGYNAWRIPPMTPVEDVRKHLDTIIKQIRATKHDVHSTSTSVTPKRAAAKPRKAATRKRKPSETGGAVATPTPAEG